MQKFIYNKDTDTIQSIDMTEEEEKAAIAARQAAIDSLPGEGSNVATYRGANGKQLLMFRVTDDFIEKMRPETEKMNELKETACRLYIWAWELADERCGQILKGETDIQPMPEYRLKLSDIRLRITEIQAKVSDIRYSQMKAALQMYSLPSESVEEIEKDMLVHETLEVEANEKAVDTAKRAMKRLKSEAAAGNRQETGRNTEDECVEIHRETYEATHRISYSQSTKPFYDEESIFPENGTSLKEKYDKAYKYCSEWLGAVTKAIRVGVDTEEAKEGYRSLIRKRYGLR